VSGRAAHDGGVGPEHSALPVHLETHDFLEKPVADSGWQESLHVGVLPAHEVVPDRLRLVQIVQIAAERLLRPQGKLRAPVQLEAFQVFLAAARRRGVHGQEHRQFDFQYGVDDAVFFGHGHLVCTRRFKG